MRSSDNTPLRIFLARHGQSSLNLEQRISGQANANLSEKGLEQAQALRDVLRHEPLTAIYASSLDRAVQTARPTAEHHGLDIRALDDLREIGLGILEGRYVDERDSEACRLWAERSVNRRGFTVAGGESYPEFEARVLNCLEQIRITSYGSILIVGHRNTNEVILARILAKGPEAGVEINVKNKYLYAITCESAPEVMTIRLGGDAAFRGGDTIVEQKPSLGCNIKWKPGAEPEYARG